MADPLFDEFERGVRRDIHITLFEGEITVLDRLADGNACTRGTVIGALLKKYHNADLPIPEGADQARKRKKNHADD